MTDDQQIATLPPLEELRGDVIRSRRTGEPRRPAVVLIAAIIFYLAAAGVAVAYAQHWWQAAHPASYPTSARLVDWVDPAPGKWLSLTLEGCLAVGAVAAAGAAAVVGFQAWNGWRWARLASIGALVLVGGFTTVTSNGAYVGLGLTVVGSALLLFPAVSRYFGEQERSRAMPPTPYRRPERIVYGRLPRFR